MTEACSGHSGSLASINWYVVPEASEISVQGKEYSGFWFDQGNKIVIAGASQSDGPLVRHEMLHALLGFDGHPRNEFLERCGGVVACEEECLHDAGPAPRLPDSTLHVSPDSLLVTVDIQPATPNSASFDGYFTLTVRARNRTNREVILDLPASGDDGPSLTFTTELTSSAIGGTIPIIMREYDPEVTYFEPGETKRAVFDLHLGAPNDGGFPVGNYSAIGEYGGTKSAATVFALTP